jgi:UPF0755 protein
MRPRSALAIGLGLLLALSLGLGAGLERAWRRQPPQAAADTILILAPGSSSRAIAAQLAAAGVLESPRLWLWSLRLRGEADELRAGRYRCRRPSSPAALAEQLRRGRTEKLRLTLREGLWLDEAVAAIATQLELDSLALARQVRDARLWPAHDFLVGRPNLEGFLLPETYAFEYPVSEGQVIGTLLGAFARTLRELRAAAPAGWSLDPLSWTTLASIVEAEAFLDEERPRIARVYLNRLARDMRLEADPTVLYALGERRLRVFYRDLRVDSAYNTYRHEGLPPGPICSPGRASLAALLAADPQDRSLFFVADGKGGHRFAATFAEHERNVAALRRLREGS